MNHILAFKVKHDSDFYTKYYDVKDERGKFKKLASSFFDKYGITGGYYQIKSLAVKIPREQVERLSGQLKKNPDKNGFYWLKKNSPMEKDWEETVTSHVDFKWLDQIDFWYMPYISRGKYSLWDFDGEIYGYLENSYERDITPDDFMEPMKLSKYFEVIERYEND